MPRAMNKHGLVGVRKRTTPQHHRKPWYARVSTGCDRFIYSKNFETAEQAHQEFQRIKGKIHMNIENELSSLVTELASLRAEVNILRKSKEILEFENDQLKKRLGQVEEQRDGHLAGKVRLKTLLDQAGQHLVSGINRYNDEMRGAIGSGGAGEEPRLLERAAE